MYINASDENSVDAVRDKIRGFASSMGFRKWKVIILDESEELSFDQNIEMALKTTSCLSNKINDIIRSDILLIIPFL